MTKKDYIIIAECIKKSLLQDEGLMDSHVLVSYLVKEMTKDNDKFVASKFIAATGVQLKF